MFLREHNGKYRMLSIDEARDNILAFASNVKSTSKKETLPLSQGLGRRLAEDVVSSINVPPADNSAMDGYAINTNDIKKLASEIPVSQRIPAGSQSEPLKKMTAARIFTGAEIPKNANAVVMQENCEAIGDNTVRILKMPSENDNVRSAGQDITKGRCILHKGSVLKPQDIGLLASVGIHEIEVNTRLRVAIFSTGDELVKPGEKLNPGQIYNSNQSMMAALLNTLGCTVIQYDAVKDTLDDTSQALKNASEEADLIITSGGVSVGDEDHVKAAVEQLGELHLWKMNVKPGKPVAFGRVNQSVFLGLPGNPVSAFVTFFLIGKSLVNLLQGGTPRKPMSFTLPAAFTIEREQRRPEYTRVRFVDGQAERFPNQSSGVLSSVCWADGLALIPQDTKITCGDAVEVFPFDV